MESIFNDGVANPGSSEENMGIFLLLIGVLLIITGIIVWSNKKNEKEESGTREDTNYRIDNAKQVQCSNCGSFIPHESKFCEECGAVVQVKTNDSFKYCSNCGAKISNSAKFCMKCGTNIMLADCEEKEQL